VHSLHNDGLAMLVSSLAFWLLVKSRESRAPWVLAAMIVLPAAGFLVKQSVMLWLAVFWLDFALTGRLPLRRQLLFVAGGAALVVAVVSGCVAVWGDDFVYWVFDALGDKTVSPARSVLAFLAASTYFLMGLFAGWVLALRDGSRGLTSLWLCWLVVFLAEATTSGIGWQVNHLGPGVLIASTLFVVALVRTWPRPGLTESRPRYALRAGLAVVAVVCLIGSLGLVRRPLDPVPADFARYAAAIEREFEGEDPARVLVDNGSWVYLREGVVMKDRASPVAIHGGKNQAEINRPMLADFIGRLAAREYDRILVRHLGPGRRLHTTYDYQDRGTGVKDALLEHYRVVRRIPGVVGVEDPYWLEDLFAEVWVFEPK